MAGALIFLILAIVIAALVIAAVRIFGSLTSRDAERSVLFPPGSAVDFLSHSASPEALGRYLPVFVNAVRHSAVKDVEGTRLHEELEKTQKLLRDRQQLGGSISVGDLELESAIERLIRTAKSPANAMMPVIRTAANISQTVPEEIIAAEVLQAQASARSTDAPPIPSPGLLADSPSTVSVAAPPIGIHTLATPATADPIPMTPAPEPAASMSDQPQAHPGFCRSCGANRLPISAYCHRCGVSTAELLLRPKAITALALLNVLAAILFATAGWKFPPHLTDFDPLAKPALFLAASATLLTGYALWRMKEYARMLQVVCIVPLFFMFPVGTVIGILLMVFLFRGSVAGHFDLMR